MSNKFCLIFVSLPDSTTAEDIAEALILRKLAAYINILPEMKTVRASRKSDVKTKPEILLIIKTENDKVERITEFMELNTPGHVSKLDITAVDITKGNNAFLNWMKLAMTDEENAIADDEEKNK